MATSATFLTRTGNQSIQEHRCREARQSRPSAAKAVSIPQSVFENSLLGSAGNSPDGTSEVPVLPILRQAFRAQETRREAEMDRGARREAYFAMSEIRLLFLSAPEQIERRTLIPLAPLGGKALGPDQESGSRFQMSCPPTLARSCGGQFDEGLLVGLDHTD